MNAIFKKLCRVEPVCVFSHERSGTHLALNLLYRNLYIHQVFLDLPVWNAPEIHCVNEHWKLAGRKVGDVLRIGGLIKSHCEVEIYRNFLPKLPVIYVVRDPRDTLVSFFYYLNNREFHANNSGLEHLACECFSEFLRRPLDEFLRFGFSLDGTMQNVVERWARHYAGWKKEPSCLIMRYEDLLGNMVQSVWRIALFAKVFPKIFMRSYNVGEKGAILPRKGTVGDWKNHFSFEDLEFTESILAAQGISLTEWDF
jgi:hypothetical protein